MTEREPLSGVSISFREQLLTPENTDTDIPDFIKRDRKFIESCEKRKALVECYNKYTNSKTPESRTKLWSNLTELLNDTDEYKRLLFYITFELLPDIREDNNPEALAFANSLRSSFKYLINTLDYRADFSDGDIIEHEHNHEPIKIPKIIHLLPWFMSKGILSEQDICNFVLSTSNASFISALKDVLPVLFAKNLVGDELKQILKNAGLENLLNSTDQSDILNVNQSESAPEEPVNQTIERYLKTKEARLKEVEKIESVSRAKWQRDHSTELTIEEFAPLVALHVDASLLNDNVLMDLATKDHSLMELIAMSVVYKMNKEFEVSREVSPLVREISDKIIEVTADIPALANSQYIARLKSYIKEFDHRTKHKSLTLAPEALAEIQKKYRENAIKCAKYIKAHRQLSRMIYPVVVSLGAHAKGYARASSDFDIGVFVKTDVMEGGRAELQSELNTMLTSLQIDGSCMEFWLEENNDSISIKNYENPDPHRGDSSLTHPYTNSWIGDLENTKSLRQGIFKMYLLNKGETIDGIDARTLWLRDIEKNLLQYRLLHKGYAYYHAPSGVEGNIKSSSIDGDGMFYDSGYREMAFGLFLRNVFLPEVETQE